MSQNDACCAHLTVKYLTETQDGLTHGWWECAHGCGAKFEFKRDVPLTEKVQACPNCDSVEIRIVAAKLVCEGGCRGEYPHTDSRIAKLEREVENWRKYAKLLGDECSDLSQFVANHVPNWKSSRYEEGVRLRKALGITEEGRKA